MGLEEKILKILRAAIKLEAEAYLYYYNSLKEANLPEVRALFIQLAEEEKKHQRILFQEYKYLKKSLLGKGEERYGGKKISYRLPDDVSRILWKAIPKIEGIDISGFILPSQFFGGDFFECYPLKETHSSRSAFALIFYDVMGHGLDISLVKSLFRSTFEDLGDNLIFDDLPEPAEMMTNLNKRYFKLPDASGFLVSASYGKYSPAKGTLKYSVAGVEPPVLFRSADGEHELLMATDYCIGIEEKKEYVDREVSIKAGDLLFFYTDGLTEAESSDGDPYGKERAIAIIKKNREKSSKEILIEIVKDLKDFLKEKMLSDEMSLLLIRF